MNLKAIGRKFQACFQHRRFTFGRVHLTMLTNSNKCQIWRLNGERASLESSTNAAQPLRCIGYHRHPSRSDFRQRNCIRLLRLLLITVYEILIQHNCRSSVTDCVIKPVPPCQIIRHKSSNDRQTFCSRHRSV